MYTSTSWFGQRVITKLPKSGYAPHERYIKTKIFKTDALAQWTKDGWDFQPYGLNEGRVRAPKRYVNSRIKWRAIPNNNIPPEETLGYYAETSTSQRFHPIAFNRERCCWVELRWVNRTDDAFWIAQRPAGDDLLCNIKTQDRRSIDDQGPLDGEDDQEATQTAANFASASRTIQEERVPTPPTHSPLRCYGLPDRTVRRASEGRTSRYVSISCLVGSERSGHVGRPESYVLRILTNC